MRLIFLSVLGLIHNCQALSSPTFCINAFIIVIFYVAPSVLSDDEQCNASANGGTDCTPKDDSKDAMVDDTKNIEETELPIWWNYDIDELFEDYFECGSITYGYRDDLENDLDSGDDADDSEDSDDNSGDDYDDDDYDDDDYYDHDDDDVDGEENNLKSDEVQDNQEYQESKSNFNAEDSEVVSGAQQMKLRKQWAVIREKYVKEVNLVPIVIHETQYDAKIYSNHNLAKQINGVSAMAVPIRIGDAGPDKGRGLFATKRIPKGTLVVNLDNGSTGIFKDGHSWRVFAVSLPDRETSCNFIEWSWVQTIPPRNEIENDIRNGLTIFIAFDESNLLNAGDWDDGAKANIRCGSPPIHEGGKRGPCRFHYYAVRDIAAGEELLIDYGEFEDLSQKGWFDIGV